MNEGTKMLQRNSRARDAKVFDGMRWWVVTLDFVLRSSNLCFTPKNS